MLTVLGTGTGQLVGADWGSWSWVSEIPQMYVYDAADDLYEVELPLLLLSLLNVHAPTSFLLCLWDTWGMSPCPCPLCVCVCFVNCALMDIWMDKNHVVLCAARNVVANSDYCPHCLSAGGPGIVSGGKPYPLGRMASVGIPTRRPAQGTMKLGVNTGQENLRRHLMKVRS